MGLLSKIIGQKKEQDAATYLLSQQLQIIDQNYRCKGGEIDLICLDKDTSNHKNEENILVFVEVKHRKTTNYGQPEEAVDKSKQRKIILCAQTFLQKNPEYQNHAMRFDTLSFIAEKTSPNWIQNAFWLD